MIPSDSAVYKPAGTFKLWQPGPLDAVRSFLLSERFQSATQLAVGVLFVSLFVFVEPLRFPGSCVAILLYFVVAVTGAPDCHVGTRIFLCGFMLGPLTLALPLGGIIATLGKLAPTPEGRLVVLCVLGPLALIPFAVNRMGTSHLYLFAMGMVSCMYLGMPILTGWGAPDIATLWERGVGFILVAAMIGMFAGSALSMVVVPSLASHHLEDEVSTALKLMGQHLSGCASHLWRPGKTDMQALPSHLRGLHPLLVPSTQAAQPGVVAPGVLDRDLGAAQVSPRQVYVAAMDWFEHLSRPPSDSNAHPKSCFQRCGSASTAGSGRSELHKNTFYGPDASKLAAAVAAAAMDSQEEQQWQQQLSEHSGLQQQDMRSASWVPARHSSTNGQPVRQQHSMSAQRASTAGGLSEHPGSLRLGSTVTSAHVAAAKAELPLQDDQQPWHTAEGRPVRSAQSNMQLMSGERVATAAQPGALMSEARQLLAHANQILEAAGAEPRWLRHGERRFHIKPWTKLVGAAQLVALRVKALDLIQRDFVSLSEEPHSFPVADDLSKLLQQLYGCAAAALAMLSEQVRCRDTPTQACAASEQILKHTAWRESRQRLLDALKATLAEYYMRIQQASPDEPVIIPSAHWVRRMMFFHTTTLSVIDALDGLGAAAEAALVTPQKKQQHSSRHSWWPCWGQQYQHDPQKGAQQQQQAPSAAAAAVAVAAAVAAHDLEAGVKGSTLHQASQGHTNDTSSGTVETVNNPTPATLQSFTSMQTGSSTTAAAAAEAIAVAAVNADIAAGPPHPIQQLQQPHLTKDSAPQPSQSLQPVVGPGPVAAAGGTYEKTAGPQQQGPFLQQQQDHNPMGTPHRGRMRHATDSVKASFKKHTVWMVPWLPMALNVKQFENLKLVAKQLPAAFGSRKAFLASLKSRSVQAVLKYWSVLTLLMVGTLLLMYFMPIIGRFNPSFGFTAAAVGMSARVESTLFKIAVWTAATIAGAAIGWAIMATPSMAFNPAAICAVVCIISFGVGAMDRGHGSSSGLLALFTLTTLASIVLCQCCGDLGVTWVSVTRGASVLVAAVIALAVQNLVLPWYTSTWALEQLGLVFKEATEVLADMVCQLYEDTEELLQQYEAGGSISSSGAGCPQRQAGEGAAAAAEGTAAASLAAVDEQSDAVAVSSGAAAALSPMQRLQLLDEAVRKAWIAEQQQQTGSKAVTSLSEQQQQQPQQQQQQQPPLAERSSRSITAAASGRLAILGRMFTGSARLEDLLQPSRANLAAGSMSQGLATQPARSSSAGGESCTGATFSEAAGGAADAKCMQGDGSAGGCDSDAAVSEMIQLLRQRRLAQQQLPGSGQQAGARRVGVTGLQLQSRLVRPLVQVKISLVLDTTAWTSGPLATPPLVLQMLRAMFDLVDALAALQQAVSVRVEGLSGSWGWMVLRVAGAWAALLLQVMQLADATAAHMLGPTTDTSAALLSQIQEVQHQRFLYFALLRELRVLLHTALLTDDVVGAQFDSVDESHLQGHLRYSACVYATGKVLDQVTAAARCALSVSVSK